MRAIEAGESFVLTRHGTPLDAIEPERFFAGLERYVDADPLRDPVNPGIRGDQPARYLLDTSAVIDLSASGQVKQQHSKRFYDPLIP